MFVRRMSCTSMRDGAITQHRYWSPDDIKPVRFRSDQDYADGLRECLDVAVRRQMRSAHPIGCLLSGGLDSSSVAVLAARALAEKNQRLTAFTGVPRRGFDGPVPADITRTKRLTSTRSPRRPAISTSPMSRTMPATISPNSTGSSSRSKDRCEIRPISAGCWRSCGSRASRAVACCSADCTAITPSAGADGRRPPVICCAAAG